MSRPKNGYPAKFGTKAPGSDQFKFENDCLNRADKGESIMELPMLPNDVAWSDGPSKPGPYRYSNFILRLERLMLMGSTSVYYIIKDGAPGEVIVTYCGAYAH